MLGYWYRHTVVHQVRAEYEQIVAETQPDRDCSFADEAVTWPTQGTLCYPVFQAQARSMDEASAVPPCRHPQCDGPYLQDRTEEEKLVFGKDRESLLEMRRKLGMELVWLKQAIASRQQVHCTSCLYTEKHFIILHCSTCN